jgi:hypothetical protein
MSKPFNAVAFLKSAFDYLGNQSLGQYRRFGITMGENYDDIASAREILQDAITAIENEPEPALIVVDLDAVERRLIAASIPDSKVIGLLPFQASVAAGDTYLHIVNDSLYTVVTNAHEIPQGETLCGRGIDGDKSELILLKRLVVQATCPGCLAKAKSKIAHHIQDQVRVR